MTAAYRLRGIGWFISSVVVVLGCYLVSLQVAAERKRVDDVNRAIVQAKRDIRALETEFSTRANMAQLERWNGDVLALAAPTADQFIPDDAALAQVRFDPDAAPDSQARNAPRVMPAAHDQALPTLPVTNAVTTAPIQPTPPAASTMTAAARAPVRTSPARTIMASAAVVSPRSGARAPDRPRAVALLDGKALRENRLADLIKNIPLDSGGAR